MSRKDVVGVPGPEVPTSVPSDASCTTGRHRNGGDVSANRWLQMIADNPGHSQWYIERFRQMAAEGTDLDGEARFVDAMVPRHASVLDAGCGPGRVGGRLASLGHRIVGVDIDPELIAVARAEHPDATWLTADLAALDLPAAGIAEAFDLVVCAGHVMTFLDPVTTADVVERLAAHTAPHGRLVIGFGVDRGYTVDTFAADVEAAGLVADLRLSSWELHPFDPSSNFLLAVLSRRTVHTREET